MCSWPPKKEVFLFYFLEVMTMANLEENCPICDAQVTLTDDIEESEVITCSDCNNRIVVESIEGTKVTLAEAPEIEEDWGE